MAREVFDYTALDIFQTCRRKYWFWGVRHLEPRKKSTALLYGGATHEALDVYYAGKGLGGTLKAFQENFKDDENDDLRTVENGIKMLEWYNKIYADDSAKLLARPESGFAFEIEGIMYGGKIDLIVEWGGDMWIMEHKTTTRLNSSYGDRFLLDKQVTGYIIAAEEYMGKPCAGCLVNAMEPWKELKRPTTKSKKPEDHFLRFPIRRSAELKDRFRLNVKRLVRDIRWCEANDEWMEAEKKEVCQYYMKPCPYRDLCRFGIDEKVIAKDYNVREWNPLDRKKDANGEV